MDSLTVFLDTQPAWHWWALGAILLALEMVSSTQYLLWPSIGAFITGVLKFVIPSLDGRLAVFLFAVFSVVATVVWKRSRFSRAERTTHSTLNDRSALYVGRRVKAAEDFANGRGAVLVDDSRWSAACEGGPMPHKGDMVDVCGCDGAILKVRQAS